MALRIICPPGPHGGIITGWLGPQSEKSVPMKIAVFQPVDGVWVACKDALEPARLWSGYVKPTVDRAVPEWMVMLVSKNYDLEHFDVSQMAVFDHDQADASPVEISNGRTTDLNVLYGTTSATPPGSYRVLPFLWRRSGRSGGWVFAATKAVKPRKNGSWTTPRRGGEQHAVFLVNAGEIFDPAGLTPADVPRNDDGRHSMALTSKIDLVVFDHAHGQLSGVVTGLTQVSTLGGFPAGEDRLQDDPLVIHVWDTETSVSIRPVECELEGGWTLDVPMRHGPLVVAVTTNQFVRNAEPPHAKGGEVIALAFSGASRRSMSS